MDLIQEFSFYSHFEIAVGSERPFKTASSELRKFKTGQCLQEYCPGTKTHTE